MPFPGLAGVCMGAPARDEGLRVADVTGLRKLSPAHTDPSSGALYFLPL